MLGRPTSLALMLVFFLSACSNAHSADTPLDGVLEPLETVELSYGFPQRIVAHADGFVVVTGWWIPDGVVPMSAWSIGVDGTVASRESDWTCADDWSLHADGGLRLACHARSGDDYSLTHATLSPSLAITPGSDAFGVPGRVDGAVLHGDTAWVADFWVGDPSTSMSVTEYDLSSGVTRSSIEVDYDWMLQRPVLRPGTRGPWLATVQAESGLTVRRLGSSLVQRWPTCVADHQRDGLALIELSEDTVVIAEQCGGDLVVSTRHVRSGEERSVVFEGAAAGALQARPFLALAGERIVVAYAGPESSYTRVRVLDRELALRAEAVVPRLVSGLAAQGDVVAVHSMSVPPEVALLRLRL